jgi:hypothetical protein
VTLIEPDTSSALSPDGAPQVPAETFLTLNGDRGAVRFLSGGLDRAHHVLARVEHVARELDRWSEVPISAAVYLVDRRQWSESGLPGMYEIPLRTGPSGIVVAVQGDAEAVANWRRWLGVERLPLQPGVPPVGTSEEAATLALADLLLQIEIARALPVLSRMTVQEAWLFDLVAHTAALVLFERFERHRVQEISEVFRRLRYRLEPWGAPLDQYNPNGRQGDADAVDRWLWYQGVLHEGAEAIVARDGGRAVENLGKLMAKERGELSLSALTRRYERLGAWHEMYGRGPN